MEGRMKRGRERGEKGERGGGREGGGGRGGGSVYMIASSLQSVII